MFNDTLLKIKVNVLKQLRTEIYETLPKTNPLIVKLIMKRREMLQKKVIYHNLAS